MSNRLRTGIYVGLAVGFCLIGAHLSTGVIGAIWGIGPVFAADAKMDSFKTVSKVAAPKDQPKAVVTTQGGKYVFVVEVVRTTREKAKGLMYRDSLAAGAGMVFVFDPPQQVAMWMRNTYIALDMLFIAADGRIVRIAQNTQPMSETIINSGAVVKWVLELNAGTAERFGFKVGDQVTF